MPDVWSKEKVTGSALTWFENSVRWLSPEAKKAMYAAAAGNLIKRGTWDGCAFNQGGIEIGNKQVTSYQAAAKAFNMPEKSVVGFIRQWDSLQGTDEECTAALREAIEKVGIFSPRGSIRVVNIQVYKSQAAQDVVEAELQQMIADGKAADVEFAQEAAFLLSGELTNA